MVKFYENKDKVIICPRCRKVLTKADKRDDREHRLACKNCYKWIWFVPKTGEVTIHDIPKRETASGARFY